MWANLASFHMESSARVDAYVIAMTVAHIIAIRAIVVHLLCYHLCHAVGYVPYIHIFIIAHKLLIMRKSLLLILLPRHQQVLEIPGTLFPFPLQSFAIPLVLRIDGQDMASRWCFRW